MYAKAKFYNEITVLKAIAALFITWFHHKWFVPESLSSLFIGGAMGNSIFFFCSGYLLSFKKESYPGQWLLNKYLRIMPVVWVTLCIIIVCSFFRTGTFQLYPILEWFFPDQFWFVRAILLYFLFSYIAFSIFRFVYHEGFDIQKKWVLFMMILALVFHVVYYILFVDKNSLVMDDNGVHCWFYWYAFFLIGCYAKNWGGQILCKRYSILECLFSIILFFAYKTLAPHYKILIYFQFIIMPILLLYVVYAFRRFANYFLTIKLALKLKRSIIFLSEITLEVYVVQYYFIKWIMPSFSFPVNLPVSLVAIFCIAYVTHIIAEKFAIVRKHI